MIRWDDRSLLDLQGNSRLARRRHRTQTSSLINFLSIAVPA